MPYHTNRELLDELTQRVQAAGKRAVLREVGKTVAGRSILGVQVAAPTRQPSPERAQTLIFGNIHGNEVISSETALGIVAHLCATTLEPRVAELLTAADVTVVPALNLDARESAADVLTGARRWARMQRANGHGVDLNRNFPWPAQARDVWHPLAGTRWRLLPWYRGAGVASEPESQAVIALATQLKPVAAVSLHSVGRLFLYPYAYQRRAPAALASFQAMASAFQACQGTAKYKIAQSRSWYAILGDLDDWLYSTFGTLAVTIELDRPLAGVGANPLRLLQPVLWMNPRTPEPSVAESALPCLHALATAVRLTSPVATPPSQSP